MPTEERQAAIVAAALQLADGASPALITTGDIATAVGVTQGALFKHFCSKDAIWVAAMRWVRGELLQSLQTAADAAPTPVQALTDMFRAHVEFVIAHPGVPRCIFHELQQPADSATKQEVRAMLQAYRKLLLAVLARAVRQGQPGVERSGPRPGAARGAAAKAARSVAGPAALDQEAAATAFIGIVQGLVMQSMLTGNTAAMRSQADRVLALYLQGIGVAP